MNASSMFLLVALLAAFGGVVCNRRLNVLGTDVTGLGFLDENSDFSEFGATSGNEFINYGESSVNIFTDFGESSNSSSGISFGNINSNVNSNNTDDEVVLGQGFNTVITTANETESTVAINSEQFTSSNGPGTSLIDFQADAQTEFEGNNLAGFSVSASDQQESGTNSSSNVKVDAFGITLDGFSNSGTTACAGSACK
eukprot:TRINITY_DN676_c0_g2_i1.p2 TRINITY_DN676_c0_g2~~TRINITY_DN676_c0_g2_i1.p2  ORF type:complete len:198 (-),score=40.24 TRINITY_DN676_c0_g2_i1:815-1408(-)